MTDCTELYLELLKRSLTHSLYRGADAISAPSKNPLKRLLLNQLERQGIVPVRVIPNQEVRREEGSYWPLFAHTLIGRKRLDSLHECIDTVLREQIAGDLIEAGVWRGGAAIFMRGLLRARGVTDRKVWLADSFRGLPEPDAARYPADAGASFHKTGFLAVSEDEVRDNFRRYDLLDEQVEFIAGWFKETLPQLVSERFALVRLDGDMYESTHDALVNLYPRLQPGGFVIVDDYSIASCRAAVNDYREEHAIGAPIQEIDWTGVLWRKPSAMLAQKAPLGGATKAH